MNIRIQQEKSFQSVVFFLLGFEKVLKMPASVIYSYIRNGIEDLCVSVISMCCLGRPGFRVLSPVLQLFVIFFYYLLYYVSTYFDRTQGLHFREGKFNYNLNLLVT